MTLSPARPVLEHGLENAHHHAGRAKHAPSHRRAAEAALGRVAHRPRRAFAIETAARWSGYSNADQLVQQVTHALWKNTMKRLMILIVCLVVGYSSVVRADDRLLGIGVNEGSVGFEVAMRSARAAGVQVIELPQQWDDIEPRPGKYTGKWFDIANAYYPAAGIKLVISLNPIDTNSLRVPDDLRGRPLDDAKVIDRYNKAVDFVFDRTKDIDLVGFAIGNEIDGTLGFDKRKWEQYARFFKATSAHVRRRRPGVPVGAKVMLPTLIGADATLPAFVNANADVIMATYYPLGTDFHVKDLATVGRDIGKLASLPGNKPIYLLEAGCPSSDEINSSPAKQAQFVREVFKAWDAHRSRVKLVNFIWLHDIAPAEVANYAKYYRVGTRSFSQYLGSLGMRTYDGKDKPAFKVLCKEMRKRGW